MEKTCSSHHLAHPLIREHNNTKINRLRFHSPPHRRLVVKSKTYVDKKQRDNHTTNRYYYKIKNNMHLIIKNNCSTYPVSGNQYRLQYF